MKLFKIKFKKWMLFIPVLGIFKIETIVELWKCDSIKFYCWAMWQAVLIVGILFGSLHLLGLYYE